MSQQTTDCKSKSTRGNAEIMEINILKQIFSGNILWQTRVILQRAKSAESKGTAYRFETGRRAYEDYVDTEIIF